MRASLHGIFTNPRVRTLLLGVAVFVVFVSALEITRPRSAAALTISEIMFNPSAADVAACGNCNLEYVEVYNEDPTIVNLSGYRFIDGISFLFPPDTWLEGRSTLVVCADEDAIQAKYGITNTIGNFTGRIDNDGEEISIAIFGGGSVFAVDFGDRGSWPAEADGTGHSLEIIDPHATEPWRSSNWTYSADIGGSPGTTNFGDISVRETEILPAGSVWKYHDEGQDLGTAWRQPGYNDNLWDDGPAQLGYGDNDEATTLSFGPNSRAKYPCYYFRRTFDVADKNKFDSIEVRVVRDDGAVVYVNGTEIGRDNMPAGAISYSTNANGAVGGGDESNFNGMGVAPALLNNGTNTIAVEIHQANGTSSDISFDAQIVGVEQILPGGNSDPIPVVINECLSRTDGERWVEIYNTSSSQVDLSGFWLSDNRNILDGYELPGGSTIDGRDFLTITASQSGLGLTGETLTVYLTRPDLTRVVDAAVFESPADADPSLFGYSDARQPDGTGRFSVSTTPTFDAANEVAFVEDLVINEIMFNPPREHPDLEYLEVVNIGSGDLDISGFRINRGVSFTFPNGTVLEPDEYLVVAKDPTALLEAHPSLADKQLLGPWVGTLGDRGERVRIVDLLATVGYDVRYYDGGYWTQYADGGGSSLELIDRRNDNSEPMAWEDSDESDKSEWETVQFNISYSRQSESEFQIRLLQAGECYIDGITVNRGATQYVPNGDFESNTSGWIIDGTHVDSRRITSDSATGNACLHVIASGKGDTRANRIERDTSPSMSSGTYTVRYHARWIAGGNLLYISGYNQPTSFQHTRWLDIPANLGTPGEVNTAAQSNQGPIISDVSHFPVVPAPGVAPWVNARVSDADGVDTVTLRWHVGTGAYSSVTMRDDGASQDGEAGDGIWGGQIPAQSSNAKIGFYIQARDDQGASESFPRETTQRPLVYTQDSPFTARGVSKRLILDDATWSLLRSRPIHSNHLLNASFVFNDKKIYYNVGTRHRGSPWHRPGNPKMYRVKFNKDELYRHRTNVNLSKYGSQQREKAAYYGVWQNSTPSTTCPKSLSAFGRLKTNEGTYTMDQLEPIDQNYLNLWFPNDSDGYAMKITAKLIFNDSITQFNPSWASWANRGSNKASYRWNFNPRSNELDDNFQPLASLVSRMAGNSSVLDNQLEDIMDVEQFLRVYAARCAHDDWDTIGIGNGQNAFCYYAPNEGRWKLLPWDLDNTWSNPGRRTRPDADSSMRNIVNRPKYSRMYAGIVNEMINGRNGRPGSWTSAEMGVKYLDRNSAAVGGDGVGGAGGIKSFLNQRRGSLQQLIPAQVTFNITTNSGNDLVVNTTSTRIEGTGWVDISSILVNGEFLDVTWTTTTRWRVQVDLEGGENDLNFTTFDVEGNILDTDSIRVTSTVGWPSPEIATISPEMALPGEVVTITGSDFHDGIRVFFGTRESSNVEFDENGPNPTELTATVPNGEGQVAVKVRNVDGRESNTLEWEYTPPPPSFLRGDANGDEELNISDTMKILFALFRGDTIGCEDAADADDNEAIEMADAILILDFLYRGGPAPAAPYPEISWDVEGETLGCEE